MKLLIIDSQPIYQEIVSWCAETKGMKTYIASDCDSAWSAFNEFEPNIVVTDSIVNGGSAFDLVEKIKNKSGGRFCPVIFLSSKIDDSTMNHCFRSGGDDFIPKPFNEVLFNTRLSTHVKHVLVVQELYKKNQDLTFYHKKTELEHEMAKQVLNHAQRHNDKDDKTLQVTRLSATSFNGDIALVKKRSDGHRLIFVGDFTGHGLAASIGALPVTQVFFDAVEKQLSIETMASEINRVLYGVLPVHMFCAAFLMAISPDGKIRYWGGGMPDCFVSDGKTLKRFSSNHLPLGILSEAEFEHEVSAFNVDKGHILMITTDGASELKNRENVMLGDSNLERFFVESVNELSVMQKVHSSLIDKIVSYKDGQPQHDDITLLLYQNEL
ncbi:fused response regulator/phosphatase [Marinomonas algicola]|uniref:fused response regulator/phosphatase n=1 Tax=Marinomonas algicola TaxID=2773454 RepID=UPI00174A8F7F|nr:fused response regulator/phosphatase [Marinomonas algicola]